MSIDYSCDHCGRRVMIDPDACDRINCPVQGRIASRSRVPFLLSDTFLIRATFCMVLFVFMIMASWYVVEIFGATQ